MERKSINQRLTSEEQLRPQGYLSEASSYTRSAYEIGPPTWIKKEIKAYSLEKNLVSIIMRLNVHTKIRLCESYFTKIHVSRPLIFSLTISACYFGVSDHGLIYLISSKDAYQRIQISIL